MWKVSAHHREFTKAAGENKDLSAFQFLLGLSSQCDFLICLKYCKFPEYQAHPYSNVSTKTHCEAKYKLVKGLLILDVHQIRLIFYYLFNMAPSQVIRTF
jgi:hypothetical protein